MLLITTIEMFPSLTDADLKYLAGLKNTDKVTVLSKEGATMPVNLFMTLSSLKCKFEIKEMDTKDLFQLGFTIGALCASATDKVTILTNRELVVDAKNVTLVSTLAGSKAAPRKPAVKASQTKAAPVKEETKEVRKTKISSAEPQKAPRKRRGKSLTDILLAYPELKKYRKVIETSEEAIAQAIMSASDAEIGLPFQLQLRGFGEEKDAIANAVKKDFTKIKGLLSQ